MVGEITVTSLHNWAMPLIRYRTGDMAAWSSEPCPCGQSFPMVERIEGRRADYLVTPEGRLVPATAARKGLTGIPGILCTQVIQWAPDRVEVRVVPDARCRHTEVIDVIRRDLNGRLGGEIGLEIRLCGLADLERSPVGKIRQCVSRLPQGDPLRFAGNSD